MYVMCVHIVWNRQVFTAAASRKKKTLYQNISYSVYHYIVTLYSSACIPDMTNGCNPPRGLTSATDTHGFVYGIIVVYTDVA